MQDVCEPDHSSATSGEEKSFEKEEEVVGVAEKKGLGEKIEMEVQKIVEEGG